MSDSVKQKAAVPDPSSVAGEATNQILDRQVQHLLIAVEHELRQCPRGMSELALIKRLQQPPWTLIGEVVFSEPEKLYPVHFLLFHTLYRLRDQLVAQGESLSISALNIQLRPEPVIAGAGVAGHPDELRAFYLDLSQYRLADDEILRMMDDFWQGRHPSRPEREEVHNAASVLGFKQVPEEFNTVKQRFRRAVMQAHPDRGGDTESIQSLNQAFATLKAHFN